MLRPSLRPTAAANSPRARSFADWKRGRRGATLVVVGVTSVVMLTFVGVGVDFARAYAFRTQVKTVADAAALAGAVQMAQPSGRDGGLPGTVARAYVLNNRVEGSGVATMMAGDVQAVRWDFDSRTVTGRYGDDYNAPEVNAIEVTARYGVQTTFGRVTNTLQIPIRETTVAALGGVGRQSCLKPWAVPYQNLVDLLNSRHPRVPARTVADALTSEDVARLRSDTISPVSLLAANTNQTTGGNVNKVVTYSSGNGNAGYKAAVEGPACTDLAIGPGSVLQSVQGAGAGTTAQALKAFCDANGGTSGDHNNFTCLGRPRVKVAMWDTNNGQNGNNLTFHVQTVGVFAITGFSKGNAGGSGSNGGNGNGGNGNGGNGNSGNGNSGNGQSDQIRGFFAEQATSGAFTGAAGLTFKPALVL